MRKKINKTNIPLINEDELLHFWGDDTKEEIARYTSDNINALIKGYISLNAFVELFRHEVSETHRIIAEHFHLKLSEVEDQTEEYPEQYSLKVGGGHSIEWCNADSDTIFDLGKDSFKEVKIKGKKYYWRWL